ncbi:MAG: metallophosphoesterase [Candidatus Hinthialibacter antarcticus]|nr:metallophosphoesterase [Candidatus Hinthialibacter antarcticus]
MNELEEKTVTPFQWLLPRDDMKLGVQTAFVVALTLNALVLVWMLSLNPYFFSVIKNVYNLNTLFLPGLFVAWAVLSLLCMRPIRWGRAYTVLIICAALLFGVRIYATHIEPHRLQIIEHQITSAKVDAPLRIVHLTDIQSANVGAYEERAIQLAIEQKPDLVLFTGDLLQPLIYKTIDQEIEKISVLFEKIDAPLGVYGVIGNVDPWMEEKRLKKLRGIKILNGEGVTLDWHGKAIHLYGVSYNGSARGEADKIRPWFESLPEDELSLVIGHYPDYVLGLNELPIDLCFAGHTHGGQIVLPGFGPIVTFSSVPKNMARGFHEYGKTRINVSAGVGCERAAGVPKIRVFCPPDFAIFEISPQISRQ